MRFWLAIALTMLGVLPGWAQTVEVRSGEHAEFSRMVFEFGSPTGWALGKTDTGYDLRVQRPGAEFDLSRVFEMIPRDRVAKVTPLETEDGIAIAVACDCHADAFEIRPGVLVIDIVSGPPQSDAQFEAPLEPAQVADHPAEAPVVSSSDAPGTPPARAASLKRAPLPVLGDFAVPAEITAPPEMHAPADDQVEQMHAELVQQLGRAAAQGLVRVDVVPEAAVTPAHPVEKAEVAEDQVRQPLKPAPHPEPNIRIETSVDRDVGAIPAPAVTNRGQACLPDDKFDIENWGEEDRAAAMIGERRRQLFGEFDRTVPSKVRALASTYIYYGFGAEAISVLKRFEPTPHDAAYLVALAEIMDFGQARQPEIFEGQLGCDAAVALWAALAVPHLPEGEKINRNAIVQTFSGLPLHLRRLTGPILIERLLAVDDIDTANLIRKAIARAPGDHGTAYELGTAHLHLAEGNDIVAENTLTDIVQRNNEMSPQAVLDLVETRLKNGHEISPDIVVTAQALAFEHRKTQLGDALTRSAILASMRNGDADTALGLIAEMSEKGRADMLPEFMDKAVTSAPDIAFLRATYAVLSQGAASALSNDTNLAVSRRLLDLGFVDASASILEFAHTGEESEKLHAELALADGAPETALGYIEGKTDAGAALLQGRAFTQMGDFSTAMAVYETADVETPLSGLAWQSGDWEAISRFGRPSQQSFANLKLAAADGEQGFDVSEPSLADTRSALDRSATLTDAISELLRDQPAVGE